MIRIKCPNTKCGKELGIDESKAGAVGACPNCGQKFRIPSAPAKSTAKAPAKQPVTAKGSGAKTDVPQPTTTKKHWQAEDDFNPYAVKHEVDKPPPEDDRVDQMVRDDWRNKKREKAWKEVGVPTTLMKVMSMVLIGLWLFTFTLVSIDVILYNFKLEQMAHPPPGEGKIDPPEMFIADLFGSAPGEAPAMLCWLIWFIILVINLSIYGTIIAGAESMKRLENYGLSMTGCILSIIFGGAILTIGGVLGLMALMNDEIKLQFPSYKRLREEKEEEEWAEMEEKKRRRREGLPLEDEDDEGRPRRRRKKATAGSRLMPLLYGGVAIAVMFVILGCVSIIWPYAGFIMVGFAFLLMIFSNFWIVIVAFTEDVLQGILVWWVPFYVIFYIITRWEECKGAVFMYLTSIVMIFLGWMLVIFGFAMNAAAQG
jgi:hypothetical protein